MNENKSPELWKMFFFEFVGKQGAGFRSLPRGVSCSEEFFQLSDQAARLMIYLWDGVWIHKNTRQIMDDGRVEMPRNKMIAIGILDENIDTVRREITPFFSEVEPYVFRLNDRWRQFAK